LQLLVEFKEDYGATPLSVSYLLQGESQAQDPSLFSSSYLIGFPGGEISKELQKEIEYRR